MTRSLGRRSLFVGVLAAVSLGAGYLCPKDVTREVEKLNRDYILLGAKAVAQANTCDERGRLQELVFVRTSHQKVVRWRQGDGNDALTRAVLFGEEPSRR